MSVLLAADTSTRFITMAVCRVEPDAEGTVPVELLGEVYFDCNRRHAERLLGAVDWLLSACNFTLEQLDALAVSVGPGSFTGIRIGVATFKGLALAGELPLIPVHTLDAMTRLIPYNPAAVCGESVLVCPILDARMKEVFGGIYRFDKAGRTPVLGAQACPVEHILKELETIRQPEERIIIMGDGLELYSGEVRAQCPEAVCVDPSGQGPRGSAVAAEAAFLLQSGQHFDADLVSPIYLRKSQAEVNRDKLLAEQES